MKQLLAGLAVGFVLAACGGAPPAASSSPTIAAPTVASPLAAGPLPTTVGAAPAAAQPAPTTSPTGVPATIAPTGVPATIAATAVSAPAALTVAVGPTPTVAAAPATPVPSTATAAPGRKFVVQEGSKLRLIVNETFANVKLPSDAVLESSKFTGQITVGSDGKLGADSKFTVDLSALKSDDSDRDDDVRDNFLETAKFRDGVFVPKELRGVANPIPSSGPVKGQLAGDLTVHGVTKPVVFDLDGQIQGNTFRGTAKTEVKITDFGMKVPSLAFLLRVEDRVRAEIELNATAD